MGVNIEYRIRDLKIPEIYVQECQKIKGRSHRLQLALQLKVLTCYEVFLTSLFITCEVNIIAYEIINK